MAYRLSLLGWLLALLGPASAQAMTLEIQGDTVFASGPVTDDLPRFEAAFVQNTVQTVVFVNSPGGDLWTGLQVARLIARKGYNTVIAGHCVSACAIMFMGGRERRFSDALRPNLTYIGIHGPHQTATKKVDFSVQPQIFAFFKQHIGERFNAEVIRMALYDMDDASAMLRVFDPVRNAQTAPYHCRSGQLPRDRCTTLQGMDALRLGLITHTDLVSLTLPPALRPVPQIGGQDLGHDLADMPDHLARLAARTCTSEACQSSILKFAAYAENRALAVPLQGKGHGLSFNRDTPTQALVAAIYVCNHVTRPSARLCEAAIVNNADVRPLWDTAQAQHHNARALLAVPAAPFYAQEENGNAIAPAPGLRTDKLLDDTPLNLPGIQTFGTQQLVTALLSPKPPVVVDVQGAYQTLPGAHLLLNGGAARQDAEQDQGIESRFAALLQLFAPDRAAPVVFYSQGRSSWLAVNAALRAQKLGYKQVAWYPGGLDSWKAANLPTVPALVRAVVN